MGDQVEKRTNAQMDEVTRLDPLLSRQETLSQRSFGDMQKEQETFHGDISLLTEKVYDLVKDMQTTFKNKADNTMAEITRMEQNLGEMADMQKYESNETLQRVVDQMTIAKDQAFDTAKMVDENINMNSREQRKRFGQVFQDMGFEID